MDVHEAKILGNLSSSYKYFAQDEMILSLQLTERPLHCEFPLFAFYSFPRYIVQLQHVEALTQERAQGLRDPTRPPEPQQHQDVLRAFWKESYPQLFAILSEAE